MAVDKYKAIEDKKQLISETKMLGISLDYGEAFNYPVKTLNNGSREHHEFIATNFTRLRTITKDEWQA